MSTKKCNEGDKTIDKTNGGNSYRYTSYEDTFTNIHNHLINSLGGYISIQYEGNMRYLDYLKESGIESEMKIALADNLQSIELTQTAGEIITRLIPLGAPIDSEKESTAEGSKANLTIESVNEGKDYLDNFDLIPKYGIIEGTMTWDDVTMPEQLLVKGKECLSKQELSGNYSDVTLHVYLDYYSLSVGVRSDSTATIDGNTETYTSPAINHYPETQTKKMIKARTIRVYNNSDGTKTCNLSASWRFDGYYGNSYIGTVTASTTVTLNAIPRQSKISLLESVVVDGINSVRIGITRYNSSYSGKILGATGAVNPSGSLGIGITSNGRGTTFATQRQGGGKAHNNMPPYITCYM